MNTVTIKIEIQPVAQPRHQIANGRAYIPAKHKIHAYKEAVALFAKQQMQGQPPWEGAVNAYLLFQFPRPKKLHEEEWRHLKKPDIDNLIKAVLDAMNGVVFLDDSQVCSLTAQKRYSVPQESKEAFLRVTLWGVGKEDST